MLIHATLKMEIYFHGINVCHSPQCSSRSNTRWFRRLIITPAIPDTGQPYSRFALALLREKVENFKISHVLYINVASSGGETLTEKRILRPIQFSYIAGITVTWMLMRKDGTLAGSDNESYLYQYKCDLASLENSTIIPINNW